MPDGLGGAGIDIGVDTSGLQRAATEHGAAQTAAGELADALRAIRLDPAALGSVPTVAAFAAAVTAAAKGQADGAAAEALHRAQARTSTASVASMAVSMAVSMVDATTRIAQGATPVN
jgi:hypothetical protein